jgi:hypothetical protein
MTVTFVPTASNYNISIFLIIRARTVPTISGNHDFLLDNQTWQILSLYMRGQTSRFYYQIYTNAGFENVFYAANTDYLCNLTYNGSTLTGFLNGSSIGTGSGFTSPNNTTRTWNIGPNFNGLIGELIVYNRALSTAERQQVEGYLGWKWGINASFPSNHPNKTLLSPPYLNPPITIPRATASYWLPTLLSGCVTWLDPTDSTTVIRTGNTITQWNDKSTSGWNLTTQNGNPVYNSYLINGRAGIDLTNNSGFISIANRTISNNCTLAMVLMVKSSIGTWGSFFTHGSRDLDIALERNSISGGTTLIHFQTANDNAGASISYVVDQPCIHIGTLTSGTSRVHKRIGGGTTTTTSATNSSTIASGSLPIRIGRSDFSESCSSYVGETVYYNRVLSTSELQQLEGYLAWKWGLQTSLPVTHPFRLWPPST